MTNKIVSLTERIASRQAAAEYRLDDLDGDLFLIEEGLDLLAAYKAITDGETRQRLRMAIQNAARTPAVSVVNPPSQPSPLPVSGLRRYKNAAVFAALVLGASALLEVADPATTDVVAAAFRCAPMTLNP